MQTDTATAADATTPPPAVGTWVRWSETDPYDQYTPTRHQVGLVVELTPEGAALVLKLGAVEDATHVGAAPTDPADDPGDALTVLDLTVLTAVAQAE
jgi:hypothetical protein